MENEELRTEWEFLRLTGSMSVEGSGTPGERMTVAFLRRHVESVFEMAGVEFDRDAALLMVTLITSFDTLMEKVEAEPEAQALAAQLRAMLDASDNRPSLLFLAGLLLEDK